MANINIIRSPEAPWSSSAAEQRGSVRSRAWRWGCWSRRPSCIAERQSRHVQNVYTT